MEEYKPNSHRYKEEQKAVPAEKKVEKVVKGGAKVRKRSELSKFTDNFISEDAGKVKSYIFMDVLLPALKKLVSDVVTDGIDMILYGETGRTKKSSSSTGQYVSYSSYSSRDRDRTRYSSDSGRGRMNLDDIEFERKSDADDVLSQMDGIIDTYNMVSVADLYDLAGLVGPHTANRFGWTNISSARVERTRHGTWVIKFPRAIAID